MKEYDVENMNCAKTIGRFHNCNFQILPEKVLTIFTCTLSYSIKNTLSFSSTYRIFYNFTIRSNPV